MGGKAWEQAFERGQKQAFMDLYQRYREQMNQVANHNGITASWFKCVDAMQEGGHSVIILSFGMDTRRAPHLAGPGAVALRVAGPERERPLTARGAS